MRNYAVLEIAKRAAALEAENERLRGIVPEVLERLNDELCAENESLHELNEKLADLLRRTMLAIRGPEPELTHWDWSDLPERAEAALAAQAVPQRPALDLAELIKGMSVSVDVSTNDADIGNRYFGTVGEVMECAGDKHGLTLLVDDVEPNFRQPAHVVQEPLTDEQIEQLREKTFSTNNPFCPVDRKSMHKAVRAAEAAHSITGAKT